MEPLGDLDIRQREILSALVCEFMATGEPAGSKTLSKKYNLGVSSATIRNVMAELEDRGLVFQPHTSAGRVPTDFGIRFFIDSLMQIRMLTDSERTMIEQSRGELPSDFDQLSRMGRLLSELSHQPTVIRSPRTDDMVLKQIRFVRLTSGEILAILLGDSGETESRLLDEILDLSPSNLERIHNYLNQRCQGRTLSELRDEIEHETERARRSMDQMILQALKLISKALEDVDNEPQIVVQGQAKLVQTGSVLDIERLRQLMELLDDQRALTKLLDATLRASGLSVLIGNEHPLTEMADCSMITSTYIGGTKSRGTLAVIGPRSMNYSKLIPLVDFTAFVLSGLDLSTRHSG